MYNNLLETEGESSIWYDNDRIFKDNCPLIRDRLGSGFGGSEFGADKNDFASYTYDDISDTFFAQAREYMPEEGRFAEKDILKGQIELPASLNEYAYCYNNPIKFIDYNGMTAVTADRRDIKDSVLQEAVGLGGSELVEHGVQKKVDKASQRMERDVINSYKQSIANKKRVAHNPNNKALTRSNAEKELVRLNAEKTSKLSKIAKGAERIPKVAGMGADVGLNVGIGVIEDYFAGASKSKTLSNAGINAGYTLAGIGIEMGVTAGVSTIAGAAAAGGMPTLAAGIAAAAGPLGMVVAAGILIYVAVNFDETIKDLINSLE